VVLALLLIVAVLALIGAGAWWSSRLTPAFYAKVVERDASRPANEGDELERRLLETRNSARRVGQWRMVVTEDQINSWFTNNLPREFPDAMPDEISAPRVAITPDRFQVGCRYRSGSIDTIVSLDLKLYLTDEPRVVAAQLRSVRAGRLPIPPTQVLQPLADAARRGNAPLRWLQAGGDPVALWTLPERPADLGGKRLLLEQLELADGQLILRGRSE